MTSRCDVPARVQRVERMVKDARVTAHVAAAERGADGAARRPCLVGPLTRSLTLWAVFERFTNTVAAEMKDQRPGPDDRYYEVE